MSTESLSEAVTTLRERVTEWLDLLPADRHLADVGCAPDDDWRANWSEYAFRESVSGPLKQAVIAIGAARYDTFADQIRRDVEALRTLALEFVKAANASTPPGGLDYWQDAALVDLIRFAPEAADLAFASADFNETIASVLRQVASHKPLPTQPKPLAAVSANPDEGGASDQPAMRPVDFKPRFKSPPCPKCGGGSKTQRSGKEVRNIVCTKCKHRWKEPRRGA